MKDSVRSAELEAASAPASRR